MNVLTCMSRARDNFNKDKSQLKTRTGISIKNS